jgi:pyrroloquinoline quinone (PQQ) biosynthesis protein C/mannose-6-phosphate isomerase-like protein (cupin superfamily)
VPHLQPVARAIGPRSTPSQTPAGPDTAAGLESLAAFQRDHAFWNSPLLAACSEGTLSRDEFREVFSQYLLYSQNFTRLLAALMTSCESDLFRSQLSENLWDEGGGREPERRHSQIFRRFLTQSLAVDVHQIRYQSFTKLFVNSYLDFCRRAPAHAVSAFLSLGTEGIVPRLYGIFCAGLLKAGLQEGELEFFHIHMECDDEHAETLANMMRSYADRPNWYDDCREAIHYALELRREFFAELYEFIVARRLTPVLDNIRDSVPRAIGSAPSLKANVLRGEGPVVPLYENVDPSGDTAFYVRRIDFPADVFDARTVEIPAQKSNEHHRHAHETLLVVLDGHGEVLVGDTRVAGERGDVIYIPRWTMHQTRNTGVTPLRLLAVTDYNLTRRLFRDGTASTPRHVAQNDRDATNAAVVA